MYPGLIYGLIVILRSDVAEHIEQAELNVCANDGDTSLFTSGDDDSEGKCSREMVILVVLKENL